MQQHQQSERKARTRTYIQAAGLLHKSGLMEAFSIRSGDDLQAYENREKAAQLLGFLIEYFEKNEFDEGNLKQWEAIGEKNLRG